MTNILIFNRFFKIGKYCIDSIKSCKVTTSVFFLLVLITLVNQLHFPYPDEFENILGGYYILHGKLPYIGFFTHHNPFAYFLAAPLTLFFGQSFVAFRLIFGLLIVLSLFGFYSFIKKRFGLEKGQIILLWSLLITIGATYWWGQMLLADTLSGYLLMVPVVLLFWIIWEKSDLRRSDLLLISIFTALTVLTTFTLSFAAFSIYIFTLTYLWFIKRKNLLEIIKSIGVISLPYIIFLLYLVITQSLYEYFYQSIVFNSKHYVVFPGGVDSKNPLRIAIVLFNNFFINFKTILVMVKDLNLGSPFAQTLALSNAVLTLYLIMERKYYLAAFLLTTVVFSIVRSNPYTTAETDYQGMPYHLLSIFSCIIVLYFLQKSLKERINDAKKAVYITSLLILGLYFIFFNLHLFEKAFEKGYQKYMGKQSVIYDRPSVAHTLNNLLSKDDFYFLGPFDFENHLYMNSKLASKYIVVIPAMDSATKIQEELLEDLKKNTPKIIVYDTEFRIFNQKPGSFLRTFISDNYFNLESLGAPCLTVKAKTKWFGTYDFERHFFFRNDLKDIMLNKLKDESLIERVDPDKIPDFCHDRFRDLLPTKKT